MTSIAGWVSAEEYALADASRVRDYVALLKPRVMSLVVFCGAIGMFMAPAKLHWFQSFMVVLCIAAATGASAAFNMWYERDIDALMKRTQNRPVAAGRIEPDEALWFSVVLGMFSVLMMGMVSNWHAAFWLAAAIASYAGLYSVILKRRTPQNIVIGGIAGALPPLIGWIAVTGEMALLPWLMVAVIFFWTPPHFWALALYKHDDYRVAGVPMLPVVAGEAKTIKAIIFYSMLLAVVSMVPAVMQLVGMVYTVAAAVLNLTLGAYVWRLADKATPKRAISLFFYSILYLFALFIAFFVDYWIG